MPELSKHFSTSLNCCRWIAALLVVFQHVRHILFPEYGELAHKNALMAAFYFITGLGSEAVIVFFVISGFLVGGGALRKFLDGRYDARDYALHRFSRIYIVLVPALLVGCALDFLGMTYFNQSLIYTGPPRAPLMETVAQTLNLPVLFGNLANLQNLYVPVVGSNGPLWSLAYEWWYYCIFWAFLGLIWRASSLTARVLYGIGLVLMLVLLPGKLLLWFSLWLLGLGLGWASTSRLRVPPLAGLALFVLTLAAVRLSYRWSGGAPDPVYVSYLRDLAVAIACFVMLMSFSRLRSFRFGSAGFHRNMAEFSYTTYLVHFPAMLFLTAASHDLFGTGFWQQPSPALYLRFVATIGLLYVYAWCFSRLTEQHTQSLREWLHTLFAKPRPLST
jgi:peptidoglycan/LPS O-acetylase OafA/YrhL